MQKEILLGREEFVLSSADQYLTVNFTALRDLVALDRVTVTDETTKAAYINVYVKRGNVLYPMEQFVPALAGTINAVKNKVYLRGDDKLVIYVNTGVAGDKVVISYFGYILRGKYLE